MTKPVYGIGNMLRSVARHLRPYRWQVVVISSLILVDLAVESLMPLSLKYLIDKAIIPQSVKLLVLILSLLAVIGVTATVASLFRDWMYARLGTSLINDLRLKLFAHLQQLSMNFYARSQVGDLLSRFANDLSAVESMVISALPTSFRSLVGLVISGGLLFMIEWRLALISVLGVILCFRGAQKLEPRANRASFQMREEQGKVTALLQENLSAQATVKGFGLENRTVEKLQKMLQGLFGLTVRANVLSYFIERIPNVGVLLLGLVVIGAGALLAFRGEITVGELVAFQGLFVNVTCYVGGFTWVVPQLVAATAGMQRVEEILEEIPQVTEMTGATALPPLSRNLEFCNVSFSYTGEKRNLDSVNLSIPRGTWAAFVGPSGSGKSTVLTLVLRFYDPTTGAVLLDGQDLREANQESLRSQIGVVFQENFLFNTSIRENIRIGRHNATDDEVETAARMAGIHDFILKLPDGYETLAGERGGRLSGGQRQLIGIARAVLRNPAILILDEATSALDPATEAAVNATLEEVAKDRTVLAVTHRLASARHADCIYVMNDGRVAEFGRHEELLQRNGIYAGLWQKQAGFTLSPEGAHAEVTADRLKAIPLFADLDQPLLARLVHDFVTERFVADRTVIQEGDPGDKFYVIVRGKVAVSKKDAAGVEHRLAMLADGDHVGEMALLRDEPRFATVKTLTDAVFLVLERDRFAELLQQTPRLHESLMLKYEERLTASHTVMQRATTAGDKSG